MKLVRFGQDGQEKPGVVDSNGIVRDVSEAFKNYDEAFFAGDGILELREWCRANIQMAPVVPAHERQGPPICRPSKIICIGLNYSDHAAESGMELPPEPVVFFKATSALCGPSDALILPRGG